MAIGKHTYDNEFVVLWCKVPQNKYCNKLSCTVNSVRIRNEKNKSEAQ